MALQYVNPLTPVSVFFNLLVIINLVKIFTFSSTVPTSAFVFSLQTSEISRFLSLTKFPYFFIYISMSSPDINFFASMQFHKPNFILKLAVIYFHSCSCWENSSSSHKILQLLGVFHNYLQLADSYHLASIVTFISRNFLRFGKNYIDYPKSITFPFSNTPIPWLSDRYTFSGLISRRISHPIFTLEGTFLEDIVLAMRSSLGSSAISSAANSRGRRARIVIALFCNSKS